MGTKSVFLSTVSIAGRANEDLSYTFTDSNILNHEGKVSLFGVFHIQSTLPIYQVFIKETVKNFLDFFNRSPKDSDLGFHSQKVNAHEFLFEHSLQYTNEHLVDALQTFQETQARGATLDLKKIHFIIGALMDDTLYLTTLGRLVHAFLLYPTKGNNPSTPYSIVDIIQPSNEKGDDQPSKLFSSVISGKVSLLHSRIAIINQTFLDYISLDQLKHALTNQKGENLSHYFRTILSKANSRSDFSAIFIDPWFTGTQIRSGEKEKTISHSSIESLLEKQRGTTTVLTPGFLKGMKTISSHASILVIKIVRQSATYLRSWKIPKRIPIPNKIPSFPKVSFKLHKKLIPATTQGLQKIIHTTKKQLKEKLSPFVQRKSRDFFALIKWLIQEKFAKLPPNSKALFIVSTLFIILFIQSLVAIVYKRAASRSLEAQQTQLQMLDQKLNRAEASIISERDEDTKQYLTEAKDLFAQLTSGTTINSTLQSTVGNLQKKLEDIERKISRHIVLADPNVIANFENQIPSPQTLHFVGNTKPLLLTTNDSIYTVDKGAKTAHQINTQGKTPSILCATNTTETLAYICASSNRIVSYNTKTDSLNTTPFTDGGESLTDIALFNKRLYTLDGQKGLISRHDRSGTGFGGPVHWIKDGSTVQGGRALAIDGNIYILLEGNTVTIYTQGKRAGTVALPSLERSITSLSNLWTDDTTDTLYLIDANEPRIILIDKRTNTYLLSITSPEFTKGINDILVTKSDLFILSGGTLFQVPLEKVKL